MGVVATAKSYALFGYTNPDTPESDCTRAAG